MNVDDAIRLSAMVLGLAAPAIGLAAERPLTLDETISPALESREGIFIERECLASACAAATGAEDV